MSRRNDSETKIYVGGLPDDATSQELEDVFHRFGRIRKVWVARRPPGFAFIEFEDIRDAEDAVRALDGSRICGVRARVELSHGRRRGGGGPGGRGGGGGGGGRGGGRRDSRSRSRSRSPVRRSRSPRGAKGGDDDKRSPRRSYSRSRSRSRSTSAK